MISFLTSNSFTSNCIQIIKQKQNLYCYYNAQNSLYEVCMNIVDIAILALLLSVTLISYFSEKEDKNNEGQDKSCEWKDSFNYVLNIAFW